MEEFWNRIILTFNVENILSSVILYGFHCMFV